MRLESFQTLAQKWATTALTVNGKSITVTFSGKTAFTNGQRINLPSMPAGTILTPHQLTTYNGYIDHERGHIAYSDFALVERKQEIASKPLMALWNIFEDIRIENRIIRDFPGSRKYLDHLCHEVDKGITPQDPFPIMSLIYQESYCKYRGIDTHHIPNTLTIHFPKIAHEMESLRNCQSSQDTLDLAQKILDLIEREPEPQPGFQPQDNGNKSAGRNDNEKEAGNGNNNADNNDDYSEGKEGHKAANGEVGANSAPDEGSGGSDNSKPSTSVGASENPQEVQPTTKPLVQSLDQQAQEILTLIGSVNEIIKDLQQAVDKQWQSPQPPAPDLRNKVILPPANPGADQLWIRPQRTDLPRYEKIRREVGSKITTLKKGIGIYLMSRAQRAWFRGLEEGETLDRENLHQVILPGTPQVFKNRRTRALINTAIELTIDLSGSMDNDLTTNAAIITAEALATIGNHLKLSVTGFSCRGGSSEYNNQKGVGRLNSMTITTFKDFDEPFAKARKTLGAIRTGGLTPLGDAYGKALERILHRPEPRRIIWLISDGRPEFSVGDSAHSDLLLMKNIHQKCKRLGIITLGIEIMKRDLLKPYVDHAVFIKNHQELPRALLGTIKEAVAVKQVA